MAATMPREKGNAYPIQRAGDIGIARFAKRRIEIYFLDGGEGFDVIDAAAADYAKTNFIRHATRSR
ncbi:MAG: hypothetical protein HDKAJFGB_04126 [Anaerolineae bacterium]|nr:hypothetical protein [Anaerolineae bacterium]